MNEREVLTTFLYMPRGKREKLLRVARQIRSVTMGDILDVTEWLLGEYTSSERRQREYKESYPTVKRA